MTTGADGHRGGTSEIMPLHYPYIGESCLLMRYVLASRDISDLTTAPLRREGRQKRGHASAYRSLQSPLHQVKAKSASPSSCLWHRHTVFAAFSRLVSSLWEPSRRLEAQFGAWCLRIERDDKRRSSRQIIGLRGLALTAAFRRQSVYSERP